MRRFDRLAVAALIITLGMTTGAFATSEPTVDEHAELLALELERFYTQLTGLAPGEPVIRKIDKNVYSMTLELDAEAASAVAVSGFRTLGVGQQRSTPTNPGFVSNPVELSARSILNFWWAVYNGTGADVTATTRLTVKGAGRTFLAQNEERTYEAGAITIYWEGVNQPLETPGLYTVRARVAGGGARKTSFIAE